MTTVFAKGVDISGNNTNVNYVALKTEGISYAIVKAGQFSTKDQKFYPSYFGDGKTQAFPFHVKGLNDAGITNIGAYVYATARNVNEAKMEAEGALKVIGNTKLTYPVYYDMEYETNASIPNSTQAAILDTFCSVIKSAGFYPALYINPAWLEGHLKGTDAYNGKYDIWLAAWNDNPLNKSKYDGKYGQKMWQWGCYYYSGTKYYIAPTAIRSTGKIGAVNVPLIDGNVCYVDYPLIIGSNTTIKPLTTTNSTLPSYIEYAVASDTYRIRKSPDTDASLSTPIGLINKGTLYYRFKGVSVNNDNETWSSICDKAGNFIGWSAVK